MLYCLSFTPLANNHRWKNIGAVGSRMVSLTTTQRDLLNLLLTTERAVSVSTIGEELGLTPRQIHYSLREIKTWLSRRNAPLHNTSGVGVQIICAADQRHRLLSELSSQSKFQLILSPGQRQQMLGLPAGPCRRRFLRHK